MPIDAVDPLAADLWALWDLNGNGDDSTSNGRSLNAGSGTFGAGKVGNACLTGNLNREPNDVASSPLTTTDVSLMCWLKPVAASGKNVTGGVVGWDTLFQFAYDDSGSAAEVLASVGSLWSGEIVVTGLTYGAWTHLALTWKFSTQTAKFYVNGSETATATGDPGEGNLNEGSAVYAKATAQRSSPLDQVALYLGRCLTAADVIDAYAGGAGRVITP